MSSTLLVTLVGILVIAAVGFLGRREATGDLSEWTVGGREFGALTMWFLQAGEVFTTFTFLGMAGLAFTGGVAALYALPYIPLAYVGLYFLGPGHLAARPPARAPHPGGLPRRLLRLQAARLRHRGLRRRVPAALPPAADHRTRVWRCSSPPATSTSSTVSIVIAFVLVVAFVLWAGIKGVASTSYLKDALMLVVLLVLVVAIPAHFAGGIGATFQKVMAQHPDMLHVHGGPFDSSWFFSSMIASTLGVLFMTLPHQWPALLSGESPRAVRRNYVFLPVYSVALALPMIIGFTALLVLKPGSNSNGALLSLSPAGVPRLVRRPGGGGDRVGGDGAGGRAHRGDVLAGRAQHRAALRGAGTSTSSTRARS